MDAAQLAIKHLLYVNLVDAWRLLQSGLILKGIIVIFVVSLSICLLAGMSVAQVFITSLLLPLFLVLTECIMLLLAFVIINSWKVLGCIWVVACLIAIFCASIIFIPQSHEVLIGLAEYAQGYSSRWSYTPYWSFWLGLALLSLYTWLYARYMLFGCSSRALGLLNKLIYNFSPWFFAILPLLAIFYIGIDLKRKYDLPPETKTYIGFWFPRYIVATGIFVSALIHFMENGGVVQGLKEVLSETQTGKPPTVKECREHLSKSKKAEWITSSPKRAEWITRIILAIPLGCLSCLLAFPFILGYKDVWPGPASWLVFWAISMIGVATLIHFVQSRTELQLIPIILILPIAFSVPSWNDNHQIEQLAGATLAEEAGRPELSVPEMSRNTENSDRKTEEFEERFEGWLKPRLEIWRKQHPPNAPYPLFIIAAEGGGARAGHWTATVLGTLQDYCPQFAQHVFAISGVSGGSVGAAVFAASVAQAGHKLNSDPCRSGMEADRDRRYRDMANKFFAQDLLSPLLVGALVHDLVQRTIPYPFGELDRARAFEHGLENAWRVADGNSLGDNRFAKAFAEL